MMPAFARVYTGADGKSQLVEMEPTFVSFVDTEGAHGEGTPMEAATGITIRRNPPGYFLDWHNAPRRQYTITIAGEVEIGTSDGSVRRFGPGSVLLAEDLTGQGHTTRVVGTEARYTIIVPLAD
jgi:quercetin dioxygenase-like cupin family protein